MDERLYKFAKIVEVGSFTKAAAELHLSQPALSTTIKNLERELGCQLLIREGRRIIVTTAGEIVYAATKELDDRVQNLKQRLTNHEAKQRTVSVGMIDSIAQASFVYSDGFGLLDSGQAKVSLTVDNSGQLLTAVEQGHIDGAFITRQKQTIPRVLSMQVIGVEPLVLVTSSSMAKATKKQLEADTLDSFISYNRNSTTNKLLSRTFESHGINLQTIFYSTSPEVILQIVLSGRGVAALPYLLAKDHLFSGNLLPLYIRNSCLIGREVSFIQRKNRVNPQIIDDIRKHTQQVLSKINSEAAAKLHK